jgi:hypothetical protein
VLDSEYCGCEKENGGDPSSIDLKVSDEMDDSAYYDIYGRKVTHTTAGNIYIHAGNKILIR